MEIPLTQGKVALVDDDDYQRVSKYRWRFDGRYATSRVNKRNPNKIYLHRLILGAKSGEMIDHISGDKMDNRKENLRKLTYQQNAVNCKIHAHNSTGYKGVYRYKRGRKPWRAAITHNDRQLSLGYFDNPHDAARAYNKKAIEIYGEYARLNEIKEVG